MVGRASTENTLGLIAKLAMSPRIQGCIKAKVLLTYLILGSLAGEPIPGWGPVQYTRWARGSHGRNSETKKTDWPFTCDERYTDDYSRATSINLPFINAQAIREWHLFRHS